MQAEQWTTEPPTEPGIYWAWKDEKAIIVEVQAWENYSEFNVCELGNEYLHYVEEYSHWQGPIVPQGQP